MSIASELMVLQGYIGDAYDAVNDKGGTIPANKNMANLATAIASIAGGGGAKVTYGEFKPSSDQSVASGQGPIITHNLGQVPDFIMVYARSVAAPNDFAAMGFFRSASDYYQKSFTIQALQKSPSSSYQYIMGFTTAGPYEFKMDATTFQIRGVNNDGKIRSGVNVVWIAGILG